VINKLINLANTLDEAGFKKEADSIDAIIKIAFLEDPAKAKWITNFLKGARTANLATPAKNVTPVGLGIFLVVTVGTELGLDYLESPYAEEALTMDEIADAIEKIKSAKINTDFIDDYGYPRGHGGGQDAPSEPGIKLPPGGGHPQPGTRGHKEWMKGYAAGINGGRSIPEGDVGIYEDGYADGQAMAERKGLVLQFKAKIKEELEEEEAPGHRIDPEEEGDDRATCDKIVTVSCIALRINEQRKPSATGEEELEEALMDFGRQEDLLAGAPRGADHWTDAVREKKRFRDNRLYGPQAWGYLYFDTTDKDGSSLKKVVEDICAFLPLGGFNNDIYGIQSYLAAQVHANMILGIPTGRLVPGETLPGLVDVIPMTHNGNPNIAMIDLKEWACKKYPDSFNLILKDHANGAPYCDDGDSEDNPGGYIDLLYNETVPGEIHDLECPGCD
tara:strand:+ start:9013 stop:10350 length:1338 start_codon:yes stop_codon:yes gene_type:complete